MVAHGTTRAAWESISRQGLTPGGPNGARADVHFATTLPSSDDQVTSGLRTDSDVLIFVDLSKFVSYGTRKAYLTPNGVFTIRGVVPPWCFLYVIGPRTGRDIRKNAFSTSRVALRTVPANSVSSPSRPLREQVEHTARALDGLCASSA